MVILIDNYDSFSYNLYQMIAQLTKEVLVFRHDQITVTEIEKKKPRAIILSPGPGRPENAGICIDLVRHFMATVPILGVCLGHQAIAVAMGSRVSKAEQIVHGKAAYIFHRRENIYHDLPLPFLAGRYHSLVVDKQALSLDLLINAESGDGMIMGFKHKHYSTYGVQFHPESILTPDGMKIITAFLKEAAVC